LTWGAFFGCSSLSDNTFKRINWTFVHFMHKQSKLSIVLAL
jgi:hypothetical protein